MLTFNGDLIPQIVAIIMLVSFRVFGLFLTAPMFAFRALPMRLRVLTALVIGLAVAPMIQPDPTILMGTPTTFVAAAMELAIGAIAGYVIRLGLMAFDVLAETLSMLAGFSFAATFGRDPTLSPGLLGEFLLLTAIALAFALNIHLVLIEILLDSFKAIPFGTWPSAWDMKGIISIIVKAFQFGMILSMPTIIVYLIFNMTQAILGRTSPQLNLFSVGFAVSVPIAFVLLIILLPDMPGLVSRILETPVDFVRKGLNPVVN
ncbi:flagellar biosynthetic protein FliR [Polynucleobacter sp. 30F-ANTBAC]|jgi:flagellar biosynthetic protein FliR|uniref:flagellar biosynthetic protein FliR n=1 Tax=Polynucleobacter sp. 30F-ANTBAC TaxID=2689095 RepID=UPI001C0AA07A|nr:flagellar biosynthetic protein FliR [Polynucleobacter sp. 30F-ANTBAC]MBU3599760.1 flagellar biosynthetic protein FliR [Polynucleobacter sp. 30F-ANTBAC]